MFDRRLDPAYWGLRVLYVAVPVIAGLDKFFNLLTDWTQYLSPLVPRLLHLQPQSFMHLVGVIEIVAGIIVATKAARFGAYLVSVWLLCIAVNLLTTGAYFDIAVRDVSMAIGAFALARMVEVRGLGRVREPARVEGTTTTGVMRPART